MKKIIYGLIVVWFTSTGVDLNAQTSVIKGHISSADKPLSSASIVLLGSSNLATSDSTGSYTITGVKSGIYHIQVSYIGYFTQKRTITVPAGATLNIDFALESNGLMLDEVVITGTLKEVKRTESPVPVDVYTPAYFKKNPTPNIYEALQNVNGVRPQLNCNVCNTGDIHINGLEGPYSMVMIDGMPIVSSLSTVYGLAGIPNSLVERIEIVKGPASSLYGSEAVGGLINVITKHPQNAPVISVDFFATSWQEYNTDLAFTTTAGTKANLLTGINYYNFQNRVDKNQDHFTDVTLQNRISVFQKWNFRRKENRRLNMAVRYMYEDRWGGDMRWTPLFRGGDSIYGESIYTNRWEIIGNYQLPVKEKFLLSFSYNNHDQNSYYGTVAYMAKQKIYFSQLTWDKKVDRHDILGGASLRYTSYDDNTPATATPDTLVPANQPLQTWLPGVFVQDEITLAQKHTLLLGFRYDHNNYHGNIYTPRIAYKWKITDKSIIRFNAGTGFRVVNLFTEDHAALTGARAIEIKNELRPEKSYNININFIKKIFTHGATHINLDATAFYTYFNNRIVGDYETDPNKIIYDNLEGNAISKGISLNTDIAFRNGLKIIVGGTMMKNSLRENGTTKQQILTENFSATWAVSYKLTKLHLTIDYTGNLYSPMRLPVLSQSDPRRPYSPWWSIQNIQFVYSGFKKIEIYGGIKNILDWTPARNNPFIIARTNDPFDKQVSFDSNGQAIATPNNPYALSFDTNYVYAPNQGVRLFAGVRINLR